MKLVSKQNREKAQKRSRRRSKEKRSQCHRPSQRACGSRDAKEQVIPKAAAGDNADILENRRALGAESQSHIGLTFFFFFKGLGMNHHLHKHKLPYASYQSSGKQTASRRTGPSASVLLLGCGRAQIPSEKISCSWVSLVAWSSPTPSFGARRNPYKPHRNSTPRKASGQC